jgi:hypothetical protein
LGRADFAGVAKDSVTVALFFWVYFDTLCHYIVQKYFSSCEKINGLKSVFCDIVSPIF